VGQLVEKIKPKTFNYKVRTLRRCVAFVKIIDDHSATLFLKTCGCTWSLIKDNMTIFGQEMAKFVEDKGGSFN